jgi:hypothetical protein
MRGVLGQSWLCASGIMRLEILVGMAIPYQAIITEITLHLKIARELRQLLFYLIPQGLILTLHL